MNLRGTQRAQIWTRVSGSSSRRGDESPVSSDRCGSPVPFSFPAALRQTLKVLPVSPAILILCLFSTGIGASPPQDEWLGWESERCRDNIENLIRRDTRIRGSKTRIDLVIEPLIPTYLKSAVRLQQLQLEKSAEDARREYASAAESLESLGVDLVIFQVSSYRITNGPAASKKTRQPDAFVELVEKQVSLTSIRGKQEEALGPTLVKRASPASFVVGFPVPPSWAEGTDQIRLTLVARDTLSQEIGYFRTTYETKVLELN